MRMSFARVLVFGALVALAASIVAGVGMREAVWKYEHRAPADVPTSEAAIVLGASVYRGKPSPVLAARVDAAVELYRAKKVATILITGDSRVPSHDEVRAMEEQLIAAGIPKERILRDGAGYDTYSSMYRAAHVHDLRSATVVTQDFHMARALWIARSLGIEASGYSASESDGPIYDYLREIPASLKALLDVWTGRVPRGA